MGNSCYKSTLANALNGSYVAMTLNMGVDSDPSVFDGSGSGFRNMVGSGLNIEFKIALKSNFL